MGKNCPKYVKLVFEISKLLLLYLVVSSTRILLSLHGLFVLSLLEKDFFIPGFFQV